MITPTIISRLQWKAYLIFMCTNFAFIPLVYFCYPETANLTLEEIDYLYMKPDVTARHVADKLRRERKAGINPLEQKEVKNTLSERAEATTVEDIGEKAV